MSATLWVSPRTYKNFCMVPVNEIQQGLASFSQRIAIIAVTSPDSGLYRHATRDATGHLQEVSLHVDDLVLAVPFAGEEVSHAVGLESNGAVDEAVLVGAGVVPERIRVPERDVRRVLERPAAVGAGGLRHQPRPTRTPSQLCFWPGATGSTSLLAMARDSKASCGS